MNESLFDPVPAEWREPVRAALRDAFGDAVLMALAPLNTGGSGALIYRVEIADRQFLLRLETQRDAFRDPARAFQCMRVAADAGIAPALHHADPVAGIAIMDFLPERPLSDYRGGAEAVARDVGHLIARLHATSGFPSFPVDYKTVLQFFFGMLRESGVFAAGLLDPHFEAFERIIAAYPRGRDAPVCSHNDFHPGNIVFDGHRLWLIDWESGGQNEPLTDIAIALNYCADTPALEPILLQSCFGQLPDAATHARLILMRQLVRIFYACAPPYDVTDDGPLTDLTAPGPLEFRAALDDGRLAKGAPATRRLGRKVAFAAFMAELQRPEFQAALAAAPGR